MVEYGNMSPRVTRASRRILPALLVLAAIGLGGGCSRQEAKPFTADYGSLIHFVPSTGMVVALTFDDGPNDPYTSRILDVLDREHVPATFFLVGTNVEASPATARRIVAAGHAVGNHSYSHPRFDRLRAPEIEREIERGANVLGRVLGVKTRLVRPPYGLYGPGLDGICHRRGEWIAGWSAQASDWNPRVPEEIAERIEELVRPGVIILLHDGKETERGTDREGTVQALARLVPELKARGYRFVTLPDLIDRAAPPLVRFSNGVNLLGVQIPDGPVVAGERAAFRCFWQIPPEIARHRLSGLVHIRSGDLRVAQADRPLPPREDMWHQADELDALIPADAAPGFCEIAVGLYAAGRSDWRGRIALSTRLPHSRRTAILPERLQIASPTPPSPPSGAAP